MEALILTVLMTENNINQTIDFCNFTNFYRKVKFINFLFPGQEMAFIFTMEKFECKTE